MRLKRLLCAHKTRGASERLARHSHTSNARHAIEDDSSCSRVDVGIACQEGWCMHQRRDREYRRNETRGVIAIRRRVHWLDVEVARFSGRIMRSRRMARETRATSINSASELAYSTPRRVPGQMNGRFTRACCRPMVGATILNVFREGRDAIGGLGKAARASYLPENASARG